MVVRVAAALFVLVSALFAGCVQGEDPNPALDADADPVLPSGPGWVRVFENADPDITRLVGWELSLDEADWDRGEFWDGVTFVVAPFGNVSGWAVSFFEGTEPRASVVDVDYAVGGLVFASGEYQAGQQPRAFGFMTGSDHTIDRAVVAIEGQGGLAIRPAPEYARDVPSAEELLADYPSGTPPAIGSGSGMGYGGHIDLTLLGALHIWATLGEAQVAYGLPGPRGPSPGLDLAVHLPNDLSGHTEALGLYWGYESAGTWSAEFHGTGQSWGGPVVQSSAVPLVDSLAFGFPIVQGIGQAAEPVSTSYAVTMANVDVLELFGAIQLTFGASLEQLLGLPEAAFEAGAYEGLVGDLPPVAADGDTLILDPAGTPMHLFGVLPDGAAEAIEEALAIIG